MVIKKKTKKKTTSKKAVVKKKKKSINKTRYIWNYTTCNRRALRRKASKLYSDGYKNIYRKI